MFAHRSLEVTLFFIGGELVQLKNAALVASVAAVDAVNQEITLIKDQTAALRP
jgi:hypothetical protein